jgi:protein-tyrosine phosphatase
LTNVGLAENYVNNCYCGHPCSRWWAHPRILVGGSINDADDFDHLVIAYGVKHVISVESEHTDKGKVPTERLTYLPVPDDGSSPSIGHWKALVLAAGAALQDEDAVLYVHCQMGGSRSPAAAYAIIRAVFEMSPEVALAQIRAWKPTYGDHAYHQSYMESFEAAWRTV